MTNEQKEISSKYQLLDEIEHVLKRPGMYIGSTKPHTEEQWILVDGLYEKEELTYNPGFLKLFDEIISNSVDEYKRNKNITQIKVNVDDFKIIVRDNGGIPVIKHSQHKLWIPEMIFTNLRAGSNFDDSNNRIVAGTNGIGATAVNIFSKKFIVHTSDKKNSFIQTYTNNMSKRTTPKISKSSQGYTEISYEPDLSRFGLDKIDEVHYKMIRKRVIDIAGCNPGLRISFNGENFKFKTFKEYVDTYVNNSIWEKSKDWEIAIGVSKDGYQSVSFVNSVHTKEGGTHENYILYQVVEEIRALIKKKHKVELRPAEIRAHMFLFMNCNIVNPAFDSQTKTRLITEPKEFGTVHKVTDKFIKDVFSSEIIESLLDWIEQKKAAEERKELRKLNKSLKPTKVLKLIDAKSRDRSNCILGIFEGNCLDENTKVKIIKQSGELLDLQIKDINIGDYVISGNNKIEEIYQITKRVDKVIQINLKNGETIRSSSNHKFYIYDKRQMEFKFVKVNDIDVKNHQFVKNKLSKFVSFIEIIDVKINNETCQIIFDDFNSIVVSFKTKVCVFNKLNQEFIVISADSINSNIHMFVNFTNI